MDSQDLKAKLEQDYQLEMRAGRSPTKFWQDVIQSKISEMRLLFDYHHRERGYEDARRFLREDVEILEYLLKRRTEVREQKNPKS